MPNAWLSFLKSFRAKNPKLSMKQAMKQGAVAYKKSKGGKGKKKKWPKSHEKESELDL